ncbi:hypothetical protein [Fodinisporobacter ferrooxydans]
MLHFKLAKEEKQDESNAKGFMQTLLRFASYVGIGYKSTMA